MSITLAQFNKRENEIFAAMTVLANHGCGDATVTLEDDDSFDVLRGSKQVGTNYVFKQDAATGGAVYAVCKVHARRTTVVHDLSISYTARCEVGWPALAWKGNQSWADRNTLPDALITDLQKLVQKVSSVPSIINYGSGVMVFDTQDQYNEAFDMLVDHIDGADLHESVTLTGRPKLRGKFEQVWPRA